jgi:hypothetical protein
MAKSYIPKYMDVYYIEYLGLEIPFQKTGGQGEHQDPNGPTCGLIS